MNKSASIETAEHYVWGDGCDGWHLMKRDDLSVIQERVPAGKSEVLHYHERARQFFYVLRGTATLLMGKGILTLGEHEGLEVPPNIPHQLRNDSKGVLEFLVISAPKSHGDRIDLRNESIA